MNLDVKFQYNSVVVLSFFFISFVVLILDQLSKGKINKEFFSCYRSSIFNPLTYFRLFSHIFGHADWAHFRNNFLTILLVGPFLEDKYGSIELLFMILFTSFVTGIVHCIFKKTQLEGASGIAFMFVLLSSFVNIQGGTVPITLILICLFYVIDEIRDFLFKKDSVSHLGHLIGAICGIGFGFYYLHYDSFLTIFDILFRGR